MVNVNERAHRGRQPLRTILSEGVLDDEQVK